MTIASLMSMYPVQKFLHVEQEDKVDGKIHREEKLVELLPPEGKRHGDDR